MTVWEFEHLKHRSRSNTTLQTQRHDSNLTGSQKEWNATISHSVISAPRLGVDGVKLGHLVGNQVSEVMQVIIAS